MRRFSAGDLLHGCDVSHARRVRALCILGCVAGVTLASTMLFGGWGGLLAFSASYGLACLFDDLASR
jgi:hypothetical protein